MKMIAVEKAAAHVNSMNVKDYCLCPAGQLGSIGSITL